MEESASGGRDLMETASVELTARKRRQTEGAEAKLSEITVKNFLKVIKGSTADSRKANAHVPKRRAARSTRPTGASP